VIIEQFSGQLGFDGIDPLQSTEFKVLKRDGRPVSFDETRVNLAIESAFKGERGLNPDHFLDETTQGCVQRLTEAVVQQCLGRALKGEILDVEQVQDVIEEQLMTEGYHGVARRYIVYREERKKARAIEGVRDRSGRFQAELHVTLRNGTRERLDPKRISENWTWACHGFETVCSTEHLTQDTLEHLYDGIRTDQIETAMLLAAKSRMAQDPAYSQVAARLVLQTIYREAIQNSDRSVPLSERQRLAFPDYVRAGIEDGRLDSTLLDFDLEKLSATLRLDRDSLLDYDGLETLVELALLRNESLYFETPQICWMRIAMGLATQEGKDKTERAIEFYNVLSTLRFLPSTSILRSSGTPQPQFHSSYLLTTEDNLEQMFQVISEDARLLQSEGELSNDWTNIRAAGAPFNGTQGRSQGAVPFMRLAHQTAAAVNPSGRHTPPVCAYLETWHLDIGDFLELGRPTTDGRSVTPPLRTAHWIPDLFIKRVMENQRWTLFSPNDVSDLHDLYGAAFEQRYLAYETMADRGQIKQFMRVEALQLWRRMLASLFENGHPWITFKDPSNLRSQLSHTGVVHCSNWSGDLLLNTSPEEPGVGILGSVNLAAHLASRETQTSDPSETRWPGSTEPAATAAIPNGELDESRLRATVRTAMRMLDNAIDLSRLPSPSCQRASLQNRAIGLGLMGFQDTLHILRIPYASDRAVQFADRSMEMISYHAILASTELAQERGLFPAFTGSNWQRGMLPIDTLPLLEAQRDCFLGANRTAIRDWSVVRTAIKKHGMRNGACLAISDAPALAILAGVTPSVEPECPRRRDFRSDSPTPVRISRQLVQDLKQLGLWDEEMIFLLNHSDGSIQHMDRVPKPIRDVYRTAFEVDPKWLINCAGRRQKWIDQGQSLTLFLPEPHGKRLHDIYVHAWEVGLKTTTHLRSPDPRHVHHFKPTNRRPTRRTAPPPPCEDLFSRIETADPAPQEAFSKIT
jgi:ribonucleoside-diphosphate reductase alpha chain